MGKKRSGAAARAPGELVGTKDARAGRAESPGVAAAAKTPLRVRRVRIVDLKPDPKNARKHSERNLAAVKDSLRRFGQRQPIVIDANNVVRAGNARLEVMNQLGWEEVDVVDLPFDGADAAAFAIADNRTGELAEWNEEQLVATLREYSFFDDLDLPGFSAQEISTFMADVDAEVKDADDEIPAIESNQPVVSRLGDVWELGDHLLLCGDSTSQASLNLIAGGGIDLVVTSPPYNAQIDYDVHDDNMDAASYLALIKSVVTNCVKVLKRGRFIAWNVGVTRKSFPTEHAAILRAAGLDYFRQIVWSKVGISFPVWNMANGRARHYLPNYVHELIYMFSKGEVEVGALCDLDDTYSADVWRIHQSQASNDVPGASAGRRPKNAVHGGHKDAAHPAVFPVAIPIGVIKHLSARGETVLDPFSGAGSTIIGCEKTGRLGRGIELSPAYVDLSILRFEKLTGKKATLRKDGRTFADISKDRVGLEHAQC